MIDVLVLGDANPDLVLRGDVVPRCGQAEQLLDSADSWSAAPARSSRTDWQGSARTTGRCSPPPGAIADFDAERAAQI